MKVRWGNTLSSSMFQVGNSVKQGGILSPVLLLNHLCYADDMCFISISSAGMQELLNVCHSYSIEVLNTHYCIMEISHTVRVLSQRLSNLLSLPTYNSASEMFAVINIPSVELLR